MTTFLSVLALVSIVVAYKLEPLADLPMVRPLVTIAMATFAIVSLLAPEAAGIGAAWLIEQYVDEAAGLTAWITERVLDGNSVFGPPSSTTVP